MWECTQCHATCDDAAGVCESCGTSREGRADADFKLADQAAAGLAEEGSAASTAAAPQEAPKLGRHGFIMLASVVFVLVFVVYGLKWIDAGFAVRDLGWLLLPPALVLMPWRRAWTMHVACLLTVLLALLSAHDFFGLLWAPPQPPAGGEEPLPVSSRAILCAWHFVSALWLCAGVIVAMRIAKPSLTLAGKR